MSTIPAAPGPQQQPAATAPERRTGRTVWLAVGGVALAIACFLSGAVAATGIGIASRVVHSVEHRGPDGFGPSGQGGTRHGQDGQDHLRFPGGGGSGPLDRGLESPEG